jgi:hypothetical protein
MLNQALPANSPTWEWRNSWARERCPVPRIFLSSVPGEADVAEQRSNASPDSAIIILPFAFA